MGHGSFGQDWRSGGLQSCVSNNWKKHCHQPGKVSFTCRPVSHPNPLSPKTALQLGRFVDMLYSAQRSVRLEKDVHRITLTMSKIATALFLVVDNLLWLARMGIVDIDRRKWFLTSCRLWLYSIVMNLVRDWFEVRELLAASSVPNRGGKRETQSPAQRLLSLVTAKPGLSIDLLKNTCDFFIPMSALNHTPLSPYTIGIVGLVSSACALLQVIDPSLSLHPC